MPSEHGGPLRAHRGVTALLAVLLLVASATAQPATSFDLVDTFGPGSSFACDADVVMNQSPPSVAGTTASAVVAFVPEVDGWITCLSLPISRDGEGVAPWRVLLRENDAGPVDQPGDLITLVTVNESPIVGPGECPPTSEVWFDALFVEAGSKYWLQVYAEDTSSSVAPSLRWHASEQGSAEWSIWKPGTALSNGAWIPQPPETAPAIRIAGFNEHVDGLIPCPTVVLDPTVDPASIEGTGFGRAVALHDDTLVVTRRGYDEPDRLFVFEERDGTWAVTHEIPAPSPDPDAQFGGGLHFDGQSLIVPLTEPGEFTRFEVFDATKGWQHVQTLDPDDYEGVPFFGGDLEFAGELMFFGCQYAEGHTGRVLVHRRVDGLWVYESSIYPYEPQAGEIFGSCVVFDGTHLIVGSPWYRFPGLDGKQGRITVFELLGGQWRATKQMIHADTSKSDELGRFVGISGDRVYAESAGVLLEFDLLADGPLVTSEPGFMSTDGGNVYRAVWGEHLMSFDKATYSYDRTFFESGGTWVRDRGFEACTLELSPSAKSSASHSIWGTRVARGHTTSPSQHEPGPGRVLIGDYLLTLKPRFFNVGEGVRGHAGALPILGGGTHYHPGLPATLELSVARPLATAVLGIGFDRLDAPFKGGVLIPTPDQLLMSQVDGAGSIALATTWPAAVPPGVEAFAQFWIADPDAVGGWSASNAVRLHSF